MIYNNFRFFEIYIERIKKLKKIDEILVLIYDYSDTPFSTQNAIEEAEIIRDYCKKKSIKCRDADFKKINDYQSRDKSKVQPLIDVVFKDYNDCNMIFFSGDQLFFDCELAAAYLETHIANNNARTYLTQLNKRLGIIDIIAWKRSEISSNQSEAFENYNKDEPELVMLPFLCGYRHLDLLKKIFKHYDKTYISFSEYLNYYKKNRGEFLKTKLPEHLIIEPTNRCNHNCIMCPYVHSKRTKTDLSYENFKFAISEYSADDKITIEFSGYGEPLLNAELYKMIEYSVAKFGENCIIDIYTNGELLTLEAYKKLQQLKVTNIFVSIDAATADMYQQIHKVDKFNILMDNLNAIIAYKKMFKTVYPQIITNYVLTKINENQTMDFFKKFGVRGRLLREFPDSKQLSDELYSGKYEPYDYCVIRGNNNFCGELDNVAVADYTPPNRFFCRQLRNSIFVLSNGDVSVCRQDCDGLNKIGVLTEKPLLAY